MTLAFRYIGLVSLFTLFALAAVGQDLGSSNKLFGSGSGGNAAKPASAPKKSSAKPASATAKNTPTKKEPRSNASAKSSQKMSGRTSATLVVKTNPQTDPGPRRFTSFSDSASKSLTPLPQSSLTPITTAEYERLIDEGNVARDERDYGAAEAAYKRAWSARNRDARPVYGLGNLYNDQQRWEDAEKAYRTAISLDPNKAVSYIALSYVLIQPIAVDDLADRYEEAEAAARKAIELAPRDPLAYDQLGVAMELRGLIGVETETAYKRAMQLDADFAPPYAHIGRLFRRRGRLVEAKDAYAKAIKLATDVPTKILVAEVMQSEQRFADSEVMLREAISEDPRNPAALLGLGRSLMAQNKLAEAETVLQQALEVSQNGYSAATMLATLHLRRKAYETAETYLFRVVTTVPSYEKRLLAQQFETVGDAYMNSGRSLAAQRAYQYALKLDPENQSLNSKLTRSRGN